MRRMHPSELTSRECYERFGTNLKPCPFCHSDGVVLHRSHAPHVTCLRCEADGPIGQGPSGEYEIMQADAIAKWNSR